MTKTNIGASLADGSPHVPARIGLTNPATRFRKIFPYVGTALIAVIVVAGSATMKGMAESRGWLGHTYQVKKELADLQLSRALLHQYENARGPALGEKQAALESAAGAIRESLGRLKEFTRDDDAQQERLHQVEPLVEQHLREIKGALASNIGELNAETEARISKIIADIDTRETQLLIVREAAWDRQFRRNIAVLAFAVGACLLLLFTNMHLLREDVRSSRVATEHIRESADSYRALSARIIGLQDGERRKLGRELHDSIGQALAGLQMNLEQLAVQQGEGNSLLTESRDMVRRTAQEVRTISQLLHPPLLDVVGFVPAAQNYVQQFARRSGIEAKTNFPDDLKLPSKEAELMLFRVLQESLTNVHRHSQATAVDVWMARRDHEVLLTIQDNGRGLPSGVIENFDAGMASGVGLAGMRERLAEFGGQLRVESSHSGTIIRASIPLTPF
jgi:signal transduction histidine kinase